MKTISIEKTQKASRLFQLIAARLSIEKEEKDLKDFFKALNCPAIETDSLLVLIENKSRRTLDRAKVLDLVGDRIKYLETETQYTQVTVKEISCQVNKLSV